MADTKDLREMYFGRGMGRQRPTPTSISEAASRIAETVSEPMQALMNAGAGFLRGSTAGTLGAPADILNLLRVKQLGGKDIPYGYEYFNEVLPSAGPSKEAKVYGTLGQFVPLPSRVATAPLKAVAAIPGAIKHGATEFAKASALGAPHVMRTRGSQTIDTGLKDELSRFYRRRNPEQTLAESESVLASNQRMGIYPEHLPALEREIAELKNEVAIKNWVQGPLAKYIKRDMGTPEDPVRLLAEEGIVHTHFTPEFAASSAYQQRLRDQAGFPRSGMGVSPEARRYENVADYAVGEPYVIGNPETAEAFELAGNQMPDWMAKLPEGTNVYAPNTRNLDFAHILDVLREDLAAGRIRPEQVSKISMEQAVRRTHQYDQELAAKMDAEKAAFRSGLPVHKEYKTGYKWVELNKPGAFAAESDAMGHSVRGYEPPKGHADWVEASGDSGSLGYGHGGWEAIKSGKAKVYSLIDDKGRPHATIEVNTQGPGISEMMVNMHGPLRDKIYSTKEYDDIVDTVVKTHFKGKDPRGSGTQREDKFWVLADDEFRRRYHPEPVPAITQIKGKQNARPVDDYQPYVADFVQSGSWYSRIGDFKHTDLMKVGDKYIRRPEFEKMYDTHGFGGNKSVYTGEELKDAAKVDESYYHMTDLQGRDPAQISESERNLLEAIKNYTPPEFAEGGSVQSLRSLYFGS